MEKHLYYYPNHATFKSSTDLKNIHNVVYCDSEAHIHYDYYDYSQDYFTTVARENGTISFNIRFDIGTDMITSISYSTDNGETWTATNNTDNKTANLVIDVNVTEGDKILWKGNAEQLGCWCSDEDVDDMVGAFFSSTYEFDAQGNVMSLLYNDNFKDKTTIENEFAFACLFHDFDEEKTCKIVNAKNLLLPATTLANQCYGRMFKGCTNLITVPELPATTLTGGCYYEMFCSCTSITTAPELPAVTLGQYCYQYMFESCTSLITVPKLSATTLAERCYQGMFENCTSLTIAPQLPATTLAERCYDLMFTGCTSLTTAPELPAIALAEWCYSNMFENCTSLTIAPELPATTLANSCYAYMFSDCTNLNYIKAMFTTTPGTGYTRGWVNGVAASGTFVKNAAATWTTTGTSGIPSGWTVQTASN